MVQGPTFLSLPALSGAHTGSVADWYLTFNSQYKRSAGRNLGDTRHGTSRGTNYWFRLFFLFYLSTCVASVSFAQAQFFPMEILFTIKNKYNKRHAQSQGLLDSHLGDRFKTGSTNLWQRQAEKKNRLKLKCFSSQIALRIFQKYLGYISYNMHQHLTKRMKQHPPPQKKIMTMVHKIKRE